ncbi:DUF1054 domain-containing protein [Gracilibacillus sp. YIM 98692]|uniref:YktB family protein n=1 Tax=Gracilibacillus sp. YIM 98692 TaxID=2663532 RepID=UPI0013D4177D|nr:DUF1054 domain-containing protein [Gracilibacillus sp. YIM 98692]
MTFTGFEEKDFETFYIDGLDERMNAIKERIQPKFRAISEEIIEDLQAFTKQDMYLHVAKHARRTVNPPDDTWAAFAHNKRGYKKHPHFQIGLWHDNFFIWLAFIYELPHKSDIAKQFLQDQKDIEDRVPNDFYISLDHTKNEAKQIKDIDLTKALERFQNVKKGEFLIGKKLNADDPIVQDGDSLIQEIKETFHTLSPLYRSSMG